MSPERSAADVSHFTTGRNSKVLLLLFEALGSLACGYYGNYVFFRFRHDYGFGDLENLLAASGMGLIVALASSGKVSWPFLKTDGPKALTMPWKSRQ